MKACCQKAADQAEKRAAREAAARTAVLIVRERFWPNVTAAEIAKAGGVTIEEMREAANQLARPSRPKPSPDPEPKPTRQRVARPQGPEGTKWCTRCQQFVPIEEMGKNRSRPDGLSDSCGSCWRAYWRERRSSRPTP